MLKSIQFKIVISFLLVGLIFIVSLGITNLYNLETIRNEISMQTEINNINNIIFYYKTKKIRKKINYKKLPIVLTKIFNIIN